MRNTLQQLTSLGTTQFNFAAKVNLIMKASSSVKLYN